MAKIKRTMNCGCIVALDYDGTLVIRYCSKHKAAPDMYEALKDIMPELKEYVQEVGDCDHSVGICSCRLFNKIGNLEQALAKAEGGK